MLFILLPVIYTEGYLDRRSERVQKAGRQAASAIILYYYIIYSLLGVWLHGYPSAVEVDALKGEYLQEGRFCVMR